MDNPTPVGKKYDQDKPRYDLVPPYAFEEMVKVLTTGCRKYGPENWRFVEGAQDRYFAATERHTWAYKRGMTNDPEDNLHHLAHAACCIFFMLERELLGEDEWARRYPTRERNIDNENK